VPWSERLADYQALQAELEKQAALDAELAAVEGDDSEDADDEDADAEDTEVEDSLEESDDQEAEADSIVANELSEDAEETGRG
jgi:hypothetical protein